MSNFVDYVKIHCQSGHGGAGSAHLRREKYIAKGGPDGGDGGRGGHVIMKGNAQEWTLLPLRYTRHIKAENGQEEKQNFVGVFDKESAQKLNGTEYNDTQKYVGDYRDNRYFNGTIYNLEGVQIGTVTEGNVEYTQ